MFGELQLQGVKGKAQSDDLTKRANFSKPGHSIFPRVTPPARFEGPGTGCRNRPGTG